jgi:hypothetical protein
VRGGPDKNIPETSVAAHFRQRKNIDPVTREPDAREIIESTGKQRTQPVNMNLCFNFICCVYFIDFPLNKCYRFRLGST